MIKPIELFPGALVKSKDYGIMKVLAVGYEKIMVEDKYAYEEEFFLEEVKPIRLTPKIVEKLGFKEIKRDDSPYRYYKRGRVEVWFSYGELDSIWSNKVLLLNNPTKKEKSIHYLQKFLAEYTKIKIDFSKLLK